MDDILFAKVNIAVLDKEQASKEILAVPDNFWFWDNYRATNMLPLMTKKSIPGQRGSSNMRDGEFEWLAYTPPIIKDWFENHVFPWMGMKTRIMALKTVPKFSNLEHIDCKAHEVGSRQHKFRIVLKGQTDTLYFKTTQGDIAVPSIEEPFLMDGGWPHGMTNYTDDVKVTIAAGAPWTGLDNYSNVESLLKRSDYTMPNDLTKFF